MPNTLAHIGLQTVVTRSVLKDADLKWIYLGCIIPDLPWIIKRFILFAQPNLDQLQLHAYLVVQASLLFSLLFSVCLAVLSRYPLRTFCILAGGSLVHLILDATQTKWGNGVDLLLPINWTMLNFGWYWPEHWLSYLMTLFGFGLMLYYFRQSTAEPPDIRFSGLRLMLFLPLLTAYFLLPIAFTDSAREHDSHYVGTLLKEDRSGHFMAFDRKTVRQNEQGKWQVDLYGEWVTLNGVQGESLHIVSAQGTFEDQNHIAVSDYRVHPGLLRNYFSYVGLLLVSLIWGYSILKAFLSRYSTPTGPV